MIQCSVWQRGTHKSTDARGRTNERTNSREAQYNIDLYCTLHRISGRSWLFAVIVQYIDAHSSWVCYHLRWHQFIVGVYHTMGECRYSANGDRLVAVAQQSSPDEILTRVPNLNGLQKFRTIMPKTHIHHNTVVVNYHQRRLWMVHSRQWAWPCAWAVLACLCDGYGYSMIWYGWGERSKRLGTYVHECNTHAIQPPRYTRHRQASGTQQINDMSTQTLISIHMDLWLT